VRTRLPSKVKVAVVTAALTFVILSLFATVIGELAENRITAGFEDDLRATAADLEDELRGDITRSGIGLERSAGDLMRGLAAGGAVVRVLSADGTVLFSTGLRELGPPIEGVTDAGDVRVVSRQIVVPVLDSSGTFGPLSLPVAREIGWVQYAKTESSIQTTVNRVRLFLAFGVLGGTALAFLGGLLVARRAMRPISGLTRAAREVARTRDPDVRLPKPLANDEVSELAYTLEDMLRELSVARAETEATLERQRAFVADASHELRTPLTSVRTNIEVLAGDRTLPPEERRRLLTDVVEQLGEMTMLISELIELARAEQHAAEPEDLRLDLLVADAVERARRNRPEVEYSVDLEPTTITGVPATIERAVVNLLDNAAKWSPPGVEVEVTVREGRLVVRDHGPGIADEDLPFVFDRFYRARAARGMPGSGLGLAIVRQVAESHGGDVVAERADGGGTRMVLSLGTAQVAVATPS
jgi:signal transduction histidine kinase